MRALHFSGPEGDLYRLAHVADGTEPAEGWTRVDTRSAAHALRAAMDDGGLRMGLSDLWGALRSPGGWTDRPIGSDDALSWAERELARPAGVLALWRLARPRPAVDANVPAEAAPLSDLASDPPVEQTWVAFRLLDLRGEPLADVQYELTLADGSVQQGATDANGEARHDDIVRGGCVLVFPDLPERYWEQAHNVAE